MENRSITIVGGGIVGLCTAYHLVRRGATVRVIERSPEGNNAASVGNAGSISPGSVLPVAYKGMLRDVPRMLLDPLGPLRTTLGGLRDHGGWLAKFLAMSSENSIRASSSAISGLVQSSMDQHIKLLESIGSMDLLHRTGQLHLYLDTKARKQDQFGWALRKEYGVEVVDLDRDGLLELEPSIGPAYQAGVFLPDQGMISDPSAYSGRLVSVVRQAGVELVPDSIKAVETTNNDGYWLIGENDSYFSREMIVCAGAWSGKLLKTLGYQLPLANQRGFHVQFPEPNITLQRVVVLTDRKVFVTPMTAGLRAAGTVEITKLDSPVDMRRADALVGHVQQAWPDLETQKYSSWSGERPCLPDSLPIMGQSKEHPGLWFNFGHGHLGLTLSAAAGEEIANSMQSGKTGELIRAFNYDRFLK